MMDSSTDTIGLVTPGFIDLASEILDCERCSWYRRVDGYYPKFGGGSRWKPRVFVVAQNPGPPSAEECGAGSRPDAHLALRTTDAGTRNWLSRLSKHTFMSALTKAGFSWNRDIYVTEATKCPRQGTASDSDLQEGRKACAEYLVRELQLLKPRHIITLGHQAYLAIGEATNTELPPVQVKKWWEDSRSGYPANDAFVYPLFLPVSTVVNTGSRVTEFTQALEKVLGLIAEAERSRQDPAA